MSKVETSLSDRIQRFIESLSDNVEYRCFLFKYSVDAFHIFFWVGLHLLLIPFFCWWSGNVLNGFFATSLITLRSVTIWIGRVHNDHQALAELIKSVAFGMFLIYFKQDLQDGWEKIGPMLTQMPQIISSIVDPAFIGSILSDLRDSTLR